MPDVPIEVAREHGHFLFAEIDVALAEGRITEAGWHQRVSAVITAAYLSAGNPRGQSGYSGDEAMWRWARSIICEPIDRDGSFLDVGCANGHLMESVQAWAADAGHAIEPYGVDISPGLIDLARRRLPHRADRLFVGNGADWDPPHRFDFVRTGLDYVPLARRAGFIERLLAAVVAPRGRLIIGTYNEEIDELLPGLSLADQVRSWGFDVAGTSERDHRDHRIRYKLLWIDASAEPDRPAR